MRCASFSQNVMKLALRKNAPDGASAAQRFACAAIRARLVSQYCHGGIVIDGDLYHANAAHGLHKVPAGEWEPEKWDLFDVPNSNDLHAIWLFLKHEGAHYDWIGLLAFVGLRAGRDDWMYCFEWCWLAMTGRAPQGRVTPEMLLVTLHQ